jgi:hypothetical protein
MARVEKWVRISVWRIEKESENAFLCSLGDSENADTIWIPKSQILDPGQYESDNEDVSMNVSRWFAEKQNLL